MHVDGTGLSSERQTGTFWAIGFVAALWLMCAVGGLYVVWAYENGAGTPANASAQWPPITSLTPAADRPTLVFLAHPQCTCTTASLGELAEALARARTLPKTYVVFLKPSSMPDGWEKTALWHAAQSLPGATVVRDEDGREAERFGSVTSGQTLLYDANGTLIFSGGITASRAHPGNNAGRSAIVDLLNHHAPVTRTTQVFGCSLFASAKS
jgi:hypothetical protein